MLLTVFAGECAHGVPAQVRRELRALCESGVIAAALAEDLLLAATELMTNAVRAGAQTIEVVLQTPPPHTQIAVRDDAPGLPHLDDPYPGAAGGRGLRIIEALADQWGHIPRPGGKIVWARFHR